MIVIKAACSILPLSIPSHLRRDIYYRRSAKGKKYHIQATRLESLKDMLPEVLVVVGFEGSEIDCILMPHAKSYASTAP